MAPWPVITVAGLGVGLLFGLFGVGGSSFATPVLGLLGVPGLVAIAAPLPATIPAAVVGATAYARREEVEWSVARWCIYGGVPGTVVGALLSRIVGGGPLLVASGVVLGIIGVRILRPLPEAERMRGRARRRRGFVIVAAAAIGLFTGLLANGGGFLLVPLYVLVLGLTMPESAGTSLVVIAVLSVPTLATHWALGHIDWTVAGALALGAVPGTVVGTRLAARLRTETMAKAFGVLLIAFSTYFVIHQLITG
jgi:uncharacterized membrane protein YfcA